MNLPSPGQWPWFTIIVPTFNRRDTVLAAVEAMSKIDYSGAIDVIVVVDGSTDGTIEALGALECPHPLRVIEQANAGAAAARNHGAAHATGEILLFLDDDMIAQPEILTQHALSHADGADAVLGDIPLDPRSPLGPLSRAVGSWATARSAALAGGKPIELHDLLTGNLSVSRAVFETLGGFDPRFTAGGSFGNEDLDFGLRLLERHVVRFNPQAVSRQLYVVTPAQHLRQWHDAGRADLALARKYPMWAREIFAQHGRTARWTRWVTRPLAALPGAGTAIGSIASWFATIAPGRDPMGQLAARLLFFAREIAYWRGIRKAGGIPDAKRALVLCYHAIADLSGDPLLADYGIDPARFARQLDGLLARGHNFIRLEQLLACLQGKAGLPRRAVLLTFDDCYRELEVVARDILQPRAIPALAFAVSAMVSGSNEWDQKLGARRLELLDAEGLARLRGLGVEIGCHSRTHRSLPSLPEAALSSETAGAADDLERTGLPRPRAFAYPYGERDSRSEQAVREAGFACAFGLRRALAGPASDRFDLPRVELLARDHGWRFRAKTAFPRLSRVLP